MARDIKKSKKYTKLLSALCKLKYYPYICRSQSGMYGISTQNAPIFIGTFRCPSPEKIDG
jgi:hypothetical protein